MIKAVITDIDGILLGLTSGVNFPTPALSTRTAIETLTKNGIPLGVCTMKAFFAIKDTLIVPFHLDGVHVTDGGGMIVSGPTHTQTPTAFIPTDTTVKILEDLKSSDIYTEYYTPQEYFVNHLPSQLNERILAGRTENLGVLPNIHPVEPNHSIIKIYTLPETEEKIATVNAIATRYNNLVSIHWGKNPSGFPDLAGIITPRQATKESGIFKAAETLNIPLSHILALGDSTNDWTFMKHCGYVATLNNGTDELKRNITAHPNGYVSLDSVDGNGFADVISYFMNRGEFAS